MKKILLILMGIFLLQSNSCEDTIFDNSDDRLKINNKSTKNIYHYWQTNYPDTIIANYNPLLAPKFYKISSQKTNSIVLHRSTWEQKFECCIPSDTLQIFIYDEQVLESTPWEEVRENHLILKRYELSYQDILDRNWVIEFTD